ncbi:MAG TPA: hypothetical protein VK928_13935 [Longimicrobiales bacterium]|nr:hypothetical protein [Longimicrobiales bacterium]
MNAGSVVEGRHTSAIRRFTEGREHWRLMVETWPEQDSYRGRLVFLREDSVAWNVLRETASLLTGTTREAILASAYDMPEGHLRRVFHAMG